MCGYAYHRLDKSVFIPYYPEREADEKMLAEIIAAPEPVDDLSEDGY